MNSAPEKANAREPVSGWPPTADELIVCTPEEIPAAIEQVRVPISIVQLTDGALTLARPRKTMQERMPPTMAEFSVVGTLPSIYPEWLGDRAFSEIHGTRFTYIVGEMARGISTSEMVIAAVNAGFMGFFGSAGLSVTETEKGIREIQSALGPDQLSWGANLIHSPQDPQIERSMVDLFLSMGVTRVSASAFMSISPEIVRFVAKGLSRNAAGRIQRKNHIFAKVSRVEVAEHFMSPPPGKILNQLVADGDISLEQSQLASTIPIAEDITAEADSGGHTDNQPLTVLLPRLLKLRLEMIVRFQFDRDIRVGAAGGLGDPGAVAAAFALGAAYVLTGSINQAARESGLSADARAMLAEAGPHDVAMAPAADMFEIGAKVQVLSRGSLFAARGRQLYDLYRTYDGLDHIPNNIKQRLEKDIFKSTLEEVWAQTRAYFADHNGAELERADRDPKHKMALVFRSYLFNGAQWARSGNENKRADYQIWCGPSMGAFNSWARGTFLEDINDRSVVQIGRNLLEGAACITRAQQLRSMGVPVTAITFDFRPRLLQ